VPEVGMPIDPRNEAHDPVMPVFGEMSKGERNRIKIRVKAAMGAQAKERSSVPPSQWLSRLTIGKRF